ncbi:Carbonic anhydrase 2 [BD1-7 clade bacterium]|uniref:Carbonic anhydrase n=1 Tax=BD1-7 clade bacterium TaxID=2029982 RepID=A0A5S9R0Y9_9GAMM|nr:Carbonic anhydrase 2 [BD1-7 clade bacterium]
MLSDLIKFNKRWSESIARQDPTYFETLSESQAPEYLWIGCSDSRVPAESILGLKPGELFVHRNVANQIQVDDNNSMSVLQFAVTALKVKHIIVCGHSGCGGINASLNRAGTDYLEGWLKPIVQIADENQAVLDAIEDESERVFELARMNVRYQIELLKHHPIVNEAWAAGSELNLHGWMFDICTGQLEDLKVSCSEN